MVQKKNERKEKFQFPFFSARLSSTDRPSEGRLRRTFLGLFRHHLCTRPMNTHFGQRHLKQCDKNTKPAPRSDTVAFCSRRLIYLLCSSSLVPAGNLLFQRRRMWMETQPTTKDSVELGEASDSRGVQEIKLRFACFVVLHANAFPSLSLQIRRIKEVSHAHMTCLALVVCSELITLFWLLCHSWNHVSFSPKC